jgi:ribosomal protein S12 methylthiotransferase
MTKYYLESLGCAKNLVDSEIFASILERARLESVEYPEEADLVLLNTCSFLQDSLQELDMVLGDLVTLKREGQIAKLLVTGCVMNRGQDVFRKLYPEVDAWIGLKDFAAIEKWLGLPHDPGLGRTTIYSGFHRYLRISDGCSNNCSYCAIPSIRGKLNSVPIEDLMREAQVIAEDEDGSYPELVVIAQDTANYGVDLYGRKALPELLSKLVEIPQYQWIRVMYMHPDHFEPEWLDLWKEHPKLLPYFEIPVQHCQDHILLAMNRKTGRQGLEALFADILRKMPQAVLRSTLISGFPGETKRDAQDLEEFVHGIPFLYLGVFLYSRESGTVAADMSQQVEPETAQDRRDSLLEFQHERMGRMLESYVGKIVDVLIEGPAEEEGDDAWIGRAWFQAPEIDGNTYVQGPGLQPGMICPVLITDTIDADLFGEAVTDKENK